VIFVVKEQTKTKHSQYLVEDMGITRVYQSRKRRGITTTSPGGMTRRKKKEKRTN
jgi:hypothetical protein